MPGKGTKDGDYSRKAWKVIDGRTCYIQRTIMFRPDSISYPHKYLDKLPCIVKIEQKHKIGPNKGKLMYPDLYMLSKPVVLTHRLRVVRPDGKGGIQASKCDGYVIPIHELTKFTE
jgi:hypothetical protein